MNLAAVIQAMADEGMSGQQIAAIVARMEESRKAKSRAGNAERQRRFQAKKRNNADNGDNADNGVIGVTSVTEDAGTDLARACVNPDLPTEDISYIPPKTPPTTKTASRQAEKVFLTEFETEFWPGWPHKVDRKLAAKAFCAARKDHDLQTILDGRNRYVATKPDWQNWKSPAAWLRGERFVDVAAPAPSARAGPSSSSGILTVASNLRELANARNSFENRTTSDLFQTVGHEPRLVGSSRVDDEPDRNAPWRRRSDTGHGASDAERAAVAAGPQAVAGSDDGAGEPCRDRSDDLRTIIDLSVRAARC